MPDFILQLLRLLLQVASAPCEGVLLGGCFALGDGAAVPDPADPLAQLEVGKEEQADEVEHQENDRGARRAEAFADEMLVQVPTDNAADVGVKIAMEFLEVIPV